MLRLRAMISTLAAALGAAVLYAPGANAAGLGFEPWPELRYGRELAVRPVSTGTLSLGGLAGGTALDEHAAWLLRGGLGYSHAFTASGWSLGIGLFALDAVRSTASLVVGGHARLHAAWHHPGSAWALASGVDMWWGDDGLVDWAEAISPWAAAAWLGTRSFVGAHAGWDRSDDLGTPHALAVYGEARVAGLRLGAAVGGAWGPVHMSLATIATIRDDNGNVDEVTVVGDVRWPLDFAVGRLTPLLFVRATPHSDVPQPDASAGVGLRWDLVPGALWRELRGGDAADAPAPAAGFDPFGD